MHKRFFWQTAVVASLLTVSLVLADNNPNNKKDPKPAPAPAKPAPKVNPPKVNPPHVNPAHPNPPRVVNNPNLHPNLHPVMAPQHVLNPGFPRVGWNGWAGGLGWNGNPNPFFRWHPGFVPNIGGGLAVGGFVPQFMPVFNPAMPVPVPVAANPESPGEAIQANNPPFPNPKPDKPEQPAVAARPQINGIEVVLKVADDVAVLALQGGTRNFYGPASFGAVQPDQVVSLLVKSTTPAKDGEKATVSSFRVAGQVVNAEGNPGNRILTVRVEPQAGLDNGANSQVTGITIHTPTNPVAMK